MPTITIRRPHDLSFESCRKLMATRLPTALPAHTHARWIDESTVRFDAPTLHGEIRISTEDVAIRVPFGGRAAAHRDQIKTIAGALLDALVGPGRSEALIASRLAESTW